MKLYKNERQLIKLLGNALDAAESHLEYCGYGDSWEREGAYHAKLPEQIAAAIKAYNQYQQELRKSLTIIVANVHTYQKEESDFVVYIGRGSAPGFADYHANLGNPAKISQTKSRAQCIIDFRKKMQTSLLVKKRLEKLAEKVEIVSTQYLRIVLLCWCYPEPCHGNPIKKWLSNRLNTKKG